MIGVAFFMDEISMRFKVHHADKKVLHTKQKVVDYRHIIFLRKDTNIEYLCAMILNQKHIYIKGCFQFMLEWWPFWYCGGKTPSKRNV